MQMHGTALNEGQTAEFVSAGTKALILIANRLGPDLADNWARNGEAMQRAFLGAFMPPEEFVPAAIVIEPTITTYGAITVDHDMVLKAMIEAGHYDWVDPNITGDYFPVVGKGKVLRAPLTVHFGRDMDDADVTAELGKLDPPLRDGAIEELLAFGAKYPNLQREFPIIGRESVWQRRGHSSCPFLAGSCGGRSLGLFIRGVGWLGNCRFLAFRK